MALPTPWAFLGVTRTPPKRVKAIIFLLIFTSSELKYLVFEIHKINGEQALILALGPPHKSWLRISRLGNRFSPVGFQQRKERVNSFLSCFLPFMIPLPPSQPMQLGVKARDRVGRVKCALVEYSQPSHAQLHNMLLSPGQGRHSQNFSTWNLAFLNPLS